MGDFSCGNYGTVTSASVQNLGLYWYLVCCGSFGTRQSSFVFEIMESTSKSLVGRLTKGQAKEIVFRVTWYFKLPKDKRKVGSNMAQSASKVTGVSISSVGRGGAGGT